MIREEEFADNGILNILKADPIERNRQVSTFVGLLNSINKNSILTIDGNWGSGKTVFVKQIDYLNRLGADRMPSIDQETVAEFQDQYVTYYYNAWKNDYHDDPLESLLFNLINDLWGRREKMSDGATKVSQAFINSLLRTTTLGLYDTREIRAVKNISDLVSSIKTVNERKSAIDDILNNHLDLEGKKLLFIVDELDRCRPTFAVKLLEALKHYYDNDKLIFLLSTNNQQLSHTIQKVYGENFDGVGYLNKFYDLVFNLPTVDIDKYVNHLGATSEVSGWNDAIPLEVASYLDLSMREVNRYYSSLNLIKGYLSSSNTFSDTSTSAQLVKYVLIPLAYGLRIHSFSNYAKFVKGEGVDIIEAFCRVSDIPVQIISRNKPDDDENPVDAVKQMYIELFAKTSYGDRKDYHIKESGQIFKKFVLLMNSSGSIDERVENKND